MNNFKSFIIGGAILLSLLALSFAGGFYCNRSQAEAPSKVTETFYHYYFDTTPHQQVKNTFNTTNAYTVTPQKIDTQAVLRSYFTKRFVADTLLDSLICITTLDTVYNNQITHRKQQYRLLQPYKVVETTTTTINNKIPLPSSPSGFYAGGFVGMDRNYFSAFGVEADYLKNKTLYGLGYDIKNKAVTAKVLIKIGKQ